jgi:tetratricopeptide (TPR) repeat protein
MPPAATGIPRTGDVAVKSLAMMLALVLLGLGAIPASAQDELVAKAREAREAGRLQEAADLLEEAYAKIKKNREALQILADCNLKLGDTGRAMDYAQKALELDEKDLESLRLAAVAFCARAEAKKQEPGATSGSINGLYEDGISFMDRYLELAAGDAEILSLKGQTLYNLSRFAESVASLAKAVEADPENVDTYYFLARTQRAGGEAEAAMATFDRAIARHPDLAWLYLEKGHTVGSAQTEEAVLAAAPIYGAALAAKQLDPTTRTEATNAIWGILGTREKFAEAEALCSAWAEAHPDDAYAYWWEGFYRTRQKRDQDALESFAKSFKVSQGELGSAALEAGFCKWRMGDLESAAQWMVKAQGASIKNWTGDKNRSPVAQIVLMAKTYADKGDLAKGAKFLEDYGLKADPNEWWVLNSLGFWLRDYGASLTGDRSKEVCRKSASYYERACTAVADDPTASATERAQVHNDCGVLFHWPQYHIEDLAKGVAYYEKALKYDPNYLDALENLGLCMNILNRYEEAIPLFEKVLKQQPQRVVSRRGLAKAKREL